MLEPWVFVVLVICVAVLVATVREPTISGFIIEGAIDTVLDAAFDGDAR